MKRFFLLLVLAAVLALGACDNNIEPMKANTGTINKNPQIDQAARLESTTGGDQPATVPQGK
ncbi:hypothetical protein [Mesorhizobium sp. M7A.F.Ca.US.010.02.1.1]|uniref:hypothetical protein n=1 Tax=unclassified Mesorhizobium TaxID=325217 RepID=UPI000FD3A946|nr:hypothetical protein [Mesorhizobium sp. M7A.F.Ca.US.010.02.1.1]RUW90732.1 hypothetical protein EOA19_19080 [Mesorhizobium sp. M7A.F.Ca.US.010.02.1.1]